MRMVNGLKKNGLLRYAIAVLLLLVAMGCRAGDIFIDFDCSSQTPKEKGITVTSNRVIVKQDDKTYTFEHNCISINLSKGMTGLQMGGSGSNLRNNPYLFLEEPLKQITFIEVTARSKFRGGWLDAGISVDDNPLTAFRVSGTDQLRTNMTEEYDTYRFVPADGKPVDGNVMVRVLSSVEGFFVRIQSIRIHYKNK